MQLFNTLEGELNAQSVTVPTPDIKAMLEKQLGLIAEVWRYFFIFNDADLVHFSLHGDHYLTVAGIFEYDPALMHRDGYRNFFQQQATLVQVVPIEDPTLLQSIEMLYRMKYFKDIIVRPAIDEIGIAAFNSMILHTTVDICTKVFSDTNYLESIFQVILPELASTSAAAATDSDEIGPQLPIKIHHNRLNSTRDDRLDGIRFLRELFYLTRTFNLDRRLELYKTFLQQHKKAFLVVVLAVLADATVILTSSEEEDNGREGREDRYRYPAEAVSLVLEVFLSLCYICPMDIRLMILEGPSPSTPQQMATVAAAAGSTRGASTQQGGHASTIVTTTVLDQRNRQCLLYALVEILLNCDDPATCEHAADCIKVLLDLTSSADPSAPGMGPAAAGQHGLFHNQNQNNNNNSNNSSSAGQLLNTNATDNAKKDKFLVAFYEFYVLWLIQPFMESVPSPDVPLPWVTLSPIAQSQVSPRRQSASALMVSRRCILEILTGSVTHHTYRMKYFVMRNNAIARVNRVFTTTDHLSNRYLILGGIKFLRAIVAVKDEFYYRHIVKFDLFKPMFTFYIKLCTQQVIPAVGIRSFRGGRRLNPQDNLLCSGVLEVLDFIREQNLRTLVVHVVEKYVLPGTLGPYDSPGEINSEEKSGPIAAVVLGKLKLRYDQLMDRAEFGGTNKGSGHDSSGNPANHSSGSLSAVVDMLPASVGVHIQARSARFLRHSDEEAYFESDDDDSASVVSNTSSVSVASSGSTGIKRSIANVIDRFDLLDRKANNSTVRGSSSTNIVQGDQQLSTGANSLALLADIYSDSDEEDTIETGSLDDQDHDPEESEIPIKPIEDPQGKNQGVEQQKKKIRSVASLPDLLENTEMEEDFRPPVRVSERADEDDLLTTDMFLKRASSYQQKKQQQQQLSLGKVATASLSVAVSSSSGNSSSSGAASTSAASSSWIVIDHSEQTQAVVSPDDSEPDPAAPMVVMPAFSLQPPTKKQQNRQIQQQPKR